MAKLTYDKPSDVVAEGGRVLIDGPDHVDIALTPDAALETGGRLIDAAAVARGQQRAADQDAGTPRDAVQSSQPPRDNSG